MNAPRHVVSLLLFAALAGVAAAQRPAPAGPEPAPVAPAAAAVSVVPEKNDAAKMLAGPAAKLVVPPPLSPRFQQVRTRIEALFRHRNETPPPYDPRANPFRGAAGAGGVATPGVASAGGTVVSGPPPAPANPEMQLLQQAAAALKVAGAIQINGRAHLIINQAPYKEGDVIVGRVKGQAVYLRLKEIGRFTFTLTYNDSELAVKY